MNMATIKRIIVLWVVLIALSALFGKVTLAASDAGRTAANFLQIGVGAQSAGMGGAYSAVTEGVSSVYWNPAGLANMSGSQISLTHFSWYQDVKLNHGAIAVPINEKLTFAVGATHLDYGTIDGYDQTGLPTGQISSYDFAGSFSIGWAINDRLSIGGTAKYINQKLADLNVTGVAGDLGALYRMPRVTFAAVISNVGPFLKYDKQSEHLPTSGRLAIAVTPFGESFMTAFEFEKPQIGDVSLKQGFEYNYNHQYFVRAGYNYYPGREVMNFGTGPTFGAGVKFNRASLDYAYTPKDTHTSDDLHRFSLTLFLGR
jgi:hypothetical protein